MDLCVWRSIGCNRREKARSLKERAKIREKASQTTRKAKARAREANRAEVGIKVTRNCKGKETKGKGKGAQDVCWTCGRPGDMAKDCRRVRQIEIPAAQTTVPSSGQSTVSQTTTTTGDGNSSTGKAIRRVSQPLIFDLRQVDETSGAIRVLKETGKPKIEFYDIFTEDEGEDELPQSINAIRGELEEEEEPTDQEAENVVIIVDSGADASLFPGSLLTRGQRVIQTYGHRDVDIELTTEDGQWCSVRESPSATW